jgi:arginyl-tRNA synthetase
VEDGAEYFTTGQDDEKDRVVRKSNGELTYFASDIAYHHDKIQRGFSRLVNLWGADHHGYVARLTSALAALGHDAARLEVLLFQLVKLVRDGSEVRMGKRLGNLITLQEVMEEIDQAVGNPHAGRDALRVFYLSRSTEASIVLDVELAKKQRADNPVFYIQYGHARLCAIQRKAELEHMLVMPRYSADLAARLTHPAELSILAQLGRYPALVEEAAEGRDPHKLVFFLNDLAKEFQSYYTQRRQEHDTILPQPSDMRQDGWHERWDWARSRARLLWIAAIRTVYGSGLDLLGVSAPERMQSAPDEEAADGGEILPG